MFLVEAVAGCGALYVWRDVAAHVEALHDGRLRGVCDDMWRGRSWVWRVLVFLEGGLLEMGLYVTSGWGRRGRRCEPRRCEPGR